MEIPKSLQDLVLAHANLQEDGITAFREKRFAECIELLTRCIDKDKNNWQARLFLAMAHYSTGQIYTGAVHFRYLHEHCPDEKIKARSASALLAMDKELKLAPKLNARSNRAQA